LKEGCKDAKHVELALKLQGELHIDKIDSQLHKDYGQFFAYILT